MSKNTKIPSEIRHILSKKRFSSVMDSFLLLSDKTRNGIEIAPETL